MARAHNWPASAAALFRAPGCRPRRTQSARDYDRLESVSYFLCGSVRLSGGRGRDGPSPAVPPQNVGRTPAPGRLASTRTTVLLQAHKSAATRRQMPLAHSANLPLARSFAEEGKGEGA